MRTKKINVAGNFRYASVMSGSDVGSLLFSSPIAVVKLGRFLMRAHKVRNCLGFYFSTKTNNCLLKRPTINGVARTPCHWFLLYMIRMARTRWYVVCPVQTLARSRRTRSPPTLNWSLPNHNGNPSFGLRVSIPPLCKLKPRNSTRFCFNCTSSERCVKWTASLVLHSFFLLVVYFFKVLRCCCALSLLSCKASGQPLLPRYSDNSPSVTTLLNPPGHSAKLAKDFAEVSNVSSVTRAKEDPVFGQHRPLFF